MSLYVDTTVLDSAVKTLARDILRTVSGPRGKGVNRDLSKCGRHQDVKAKAR